MRLRAYCICFMIFSVVSLLSQSVNPLLQNASFWSYFNPVIVDNNLLRNTDDGLKGTIAHRGNLFKNPYTINKPSHFYLGLKYFKELSDEKFSLIPQVYITNSKYSPLRFTNFKLGISGLYNLSEDKLFVVGAGFSLGVESWRIKESELEPIDLGDPLLEANFSAQWKTRFTAGLFAEYEISGRLDIFVALTSQSILLGKEEEDFIFRSPPSNFIIDNQNTSAFQIGSMMTGLYFKMKKNHNYNQSLRFYYHKSLLLNPSFGGMLNCRFSIENNNYIDVGLGLHSTLTKNQIVTPSFEIGFSSIRSDVYQFKIVLCLYTSSNSQLHDFSQQSVGQYYHSVEN